MAGFNYGRMQATAERLIDRFGQSATLRRAGATTGDGWNPTPGAPTDTTLRVLDFNERVRDRDGTLIGETRRTLTVSTSAGVVPTKKDTIAVGIAAGDVVSGTVFEAIIEVRPLSPAGVDLLYEIDLGIS